MCDDMCHVQKFVSCIHVLLPSSLPLCFTQLGEHPDHGDVIYPDLREPLHVVPATPGRCGRIAGRCALAQPPVSAGIALQHLRRGDLLR